MKIHDLFQIEGASVEDTLQWAKDVARLDVNHLRSCLVTCGELCELCISLSEYYEQDLYASTFPHCSMKSSEYLWPKTKRLVKDERRSKSKLRVCA